MGTFVRPLTESDLYIGSFAAVLLSTLLAILVVVLDSSLKSMLPFQALARPGGAAAVDSLCMSPGGLTGPLTSLRLLFVFGEPLSFISDLLVLMSVVLVSLSSEAIGFTLFGRCQPDSFGGCAMSLAIVEGPMWASEALLISMAVGVLAAGFLLLRQRSGIAASAWSIATIASLLLQNETQKLIRLMNPPQNGGFIRRDQMVEGLSKGKFALGFQQGWSGCEYGILALEDRHQRAQPPLQSANSHDLRGRAKHLRKGTFPKPSIALTKLEPIAHTLFLVILCGLVVVIVYYEATRLDTPFERFMDSQSFGVNVLFISMGMIVSMFWDYFYSSK